MTAVGEDAFGPADDEPMEPIGDVADEEFGSRVRFSRLKLMAKSPAHYLACPQGEDTRARDAGTAVHAVLLGGKEVTFYPKKTKAGKAAPRNGGEWEAFKALNAHKKILSAPEYDQVQRMVDAVRANRLAMEALSGTPEETILFDFLNVECRSTPDVWAPSHWTELKTCQSADPFRFTWQAKKLAYHAQMAFHREALRRGKGITPPDGYVVAVESSPPYPVTVLKITEKTLEAGDKQIRRWFETLKSCLASNQWPPYAQSVVDLDLPDEEGPQLTGETFSSDNLPPDW